MNYFLDAIKLLDVVSKRNNYTKTQYEKLYNNLYEKFYPNNMPKPIKISIRRHVSIPYKFYNSNVLDFLNKNFLNEKNPGKTILKIHDIKIVDVIIINYPPSNFSTDYVDLICDVSCDVVML